MKVCILSSVWSANYLYMHIDDLTMKIRKNTFFFSPFPPCSTSLQSHDANSHAVRFRTCQLVNKILRNMPENAQIDDELFDKINEAMLIRLKDKFSNVRIQAVLALSRLQDPKDENCPVVNSK